MNGNYINLIGRITRDIELKEGSTGKGKDKKTFSYCYGTLAYNVDKDNAYFIEFRVNGKTAELLSEYAPKGTLVSLEGYLSTFVPKDEKFERLQVVVNSVKFLSSVKNSDDK